MSNLFKKKFMRVPSMGILESLKQIGRNAYVDWVVILFISIVVLGALIYNGFTLYTQISSGNFQVSDVGVVVQDKTFNEKDLNSIKTLYQNKKDTTEQIKKGYRGSIDPAGDMKLGKTK